MVLKNEELLAKIKELVKDNTSDAALSVLEDATDTLTAEGGEDWKAKYEENDKMWRDKYKERFFTTGEEVKKEQEQNVKDDGENVTFDDLFKKREG